MCYRSRQVELEFVFTILHSLLNWKKKVNFISDFLLIIECMLHCYRCSSVGGNDDHCLIFVEEGINLDGGCRGDWLHKNIVFPVDLPKLTGTESPTAKLAEGEISRNEVFYLLILHTYCSFYK